MGFLADSLSGLVNKITGTGTARDKAVNVGWHFERPNDAELLRLYRSTWLARKMVDIPVGDMLREGWSWAGSPDEITALEAEEQRLGIKAKLHEALTRDALYGGGALILGDGADDTSQPLLQVGRGGLRYLMVTGRGELMIESIERDPGADYGKPRMYQFALQNGQLWKIHPSRVVTFISNPVPAAVDTVNLDDFWGDSRLSSMMRDIAGVSSGVTGMSRLMDELAIVYHKISGLTEMLSDTDGEERVRRMLDLISQTKSSLNMVAVDAEDDFEVVTAALTGIPDAIRSMLQNVAGGADIPMTRFLGSSPDGMNATGDSDTRNYYDRLKGEREKYIVPGVGYLDRFLIQSTFGAPRDTVWRQWRPLWQLSDPEQVKLDAEWMTMMQGIHGSQLAPDNVIAAVVRSRMVDSSSFQGAEAAFEEADAAPDPDAEEIEAANAVTPPALRVVGDMTPRSLYIRRDVKNAAEILRWAKAQGFKDTLSADDLHVTIVYSKMPLDWAKVGNSWDAELTIDAGGPRSVERFGEATVIEFVSSDLRWRHEGAIDAGAHSDFPEYRPHITISYDPDAPMDAEPYQGKIVLGPEIFEEVTEDWSPR